MCPEVGETVSRYVPQVGTRGVNIQGEERKVDFLKELLFDYNKIQKTERTKDANGQEYDAVYLDKKSDADEAIDKVILFSKGGITFGADGKPQIIDAEKLLGEVYGVNQSGQDVEQVVQDPKNPNAKPTVVLHKQQTETVIGPIVNSNTNEVSSYGKNQSITHSDDYQESDYYDRNGDKVDPPNQAIVEQAIDKNIATNNRANRSADKTPKIDLGDVIASNLPERVKIDSDDQKPNGVVVRDLGDKRKLLGGRTETVYADGRKWDGDKVMTYPEDPTTGKPSYNQEKGGKTKNYHLTPEMEKLGISSFKEGTQDGDRVEMELNGKKYIYTKKPGADRPYVYAEGEGEIFTRDPNRGEVLRKVASMHKLFDNNKSLDDVIAP